MLVKNLALVHHLIPLTQPIALQPQLQVQLLIHPDNTICWYHQKFSDWQVSAVQVIKRAGQSAVKNVTGPTHPGRLFYVRVCNNHTRFLENAGDEVDVIPPTSTEYFGPQYTFFL